ncbi:MAG TPA: hypothetical protein PKA11_09275, partial [Accumulibacter sp.]|nr:hypothetical protein [Accumulibacter sp.]
MTPAGKSAIRLLIGGVAAAIVFGVSIATTGGEGWSMLLIVALATPVVCLQDIIRFGASSSGRQWTALVSDGV